MKLYAKTDVGRKREINQDYVYVSDKPVGPFPNLLVVADGMGGHKAGDFASKYTVKILREELESTSLDKPEEILRNVVAKANHELIRAAHTRQPSLSHQRQDPPAVQGPFIGRGDGAAWRH